MLDAVRLGPADDATAVTAAQLRDVVDRLITAGHWQPGDPDILIVGDAGYDVTRLAYVLADLPVELLGRLRVGPGPAAADARPGCPGTPAGPPSTAPSSPSPSPPPGPNPQHTTTTDTTRYGTARAAQLGPGPPPADPPHRLARPRRRTARHRGHPDPAAGRPPARRPRPETGLAVVLRHRRHTADVDRWWQALPPPIRSRAHVPPVQADPGLDPPEDPHPRRRRPVDLADHRRPHPTPPRPPPRRGPAPPLGDDPPPPGRLTPARVRRGFRQHPPEDHPTRQCAETQQARPRTPTRLQQPPASTPPRRRQNRQTRPDHHRTKTAHRLKIKPRSCFERGAEPRRSPSGGPARRRFVRIPVLYPDGAATPPAPGLGRPRHSCAGPDWASRLGPPQASHPFQNRI